MSTLLYIDSSNQKPQLVAGLLAGLACPGRRIIALVNENDYYRGFANENLIIKPLGNNLKGFSKFKLWQLKRKEQIDKVLLFSVKEKISLTKALSKLKLAVFWLETPDRIELNKKQKIALFKLASLAKVACLTGAIKDELINASWPEASLKVLPIGLKPDLTKYPALPIFPWQNRPSATAPDLTIGTVVDLDEVQRVEELLRLVKSASELGLRLQLIVIGEGGERGKLSWLAKKMDLEAQVWFVGDRNKLNRWYSCFSLLIVASRQPDLLDLTVALGALEAGVPILGPKCLALSDCLIPGSTGEIIDITDVENVVAYLKTLASEPKKIVEMGEAGELMINKFFSFNEKLADWKNYLNL